jgi:cytochrome c biogenesis protein CcmG, thiol:disulfide interchange protein DsbE
VSRSRWAGLLAVLVLLAGALVVGLRDRAPREDEALAAARSAAALPPCPAGLTTDLHEGALPCFDGGPDVPVHRAPGTPLLVNVWATWCPPCVDEVPALVSFADAARGRVGVVGVVHQDSPASVYAFAQAFGVRYPLVRDDAGGVLRRYGSGPPVTLLVRADGTVAHVQNGAFDDLAEIEDAVAEHLGVRV